MIPDIRTDFPIQDLLVQVQEFTDESEHPLTYSMDNSIKFAMNILRDPTCNIFVSYYENEPAGFAIVGHDTEFHEETLGYVLKFYVRKKFRGTGVGRVLSEAMADWFDEKGCVTSFVTSTAAIGEDQLFINLMGKVDYHPAGQVLKRNNHVES